MLAQYFNKDAKATDADAVYTELKASVPATLTVLDKSAAEDKDALVMKKSKADELGVKSIADLAGQGRTAHRRWPAGVEDARHRHPRVQEDLRPGVQAVPSARRRRPAHPAALKNGQIDAGDLFTTDPSIAANDLVALEDPKNMYAAQNVVPLITKSKSNPTIEGALNAVSAKLDTATLAALLKEVVVDKKDADAVAKEFLTKNGLG